MSVKAHTVSPPSPMWLNSDADPGTIPLPPERDLMTRTGAPLLRDPQGGGQGCGAQGWSHNQPPKAEVQVWRLGGPALGSPSRTKVLLGPLGPELRSPEQETC